MLIDPRYRLPPVHHITGVKIQNKRRAILERRIKRHWGTHVLVIVFLSLPEAPDESTTEEWWDNAHQE